MSQLDRLERTIRLFDTAIRRIAHLDPLSLDMQYYANYFHSHTTRESHKYGLKS